MKRFRPSLHPVAPYNTSEPRLVGNGISPELAIEYCRWLGEQEGLTEADQCYSADAALMAALPLTDEQLRKPGYRLPTEIEWEYVCRGGSLTPWSCGADEEFLKEFAWCSLISSGKVTSVATMRPNAFGLFDTSGNVGEWCHPVERLREVDGEPRFLLRGGSYQSASKGTHSALRYEQSKAGYSFDGFRIARTINPASDGQTALKKAVTPE
jgi:formylglycine-generating enzyme required for sulfatase activity